MWFRAVVGVAFALSGGCRQLFGIDDTDVATDGDPGDDARRTDGGSIDCAMDHLLCLDFDTPETGLGQLPFESVTGAASIGEEDDAMAPSPPRVLRALVAAEDEAGSALRGTQFTAGTLYAFVMRFALRVSSPAQTCAPGFLAIAWLEGGSPRYQLSLGVGDGLQATVDAGGVVTVDEIGFDRDAWTPIVVTFDPEMGKLVYATDVQEGSIDVLDVQGLDTLPSVIAVGISVAEMHGDCVVDVDDFTLGRE